MPDIFVIAGINGAGKTTVATRLLPHFLNITEFINADEIAKGLSPFNPSGAQIAAGRIFLKRSEPVPKRTYIGFKLMRSLRDRLLEVALLA
jgi:predicted ABC-type ATPase